MLDAVLTLFDIFISLIIDDMADNATNKKARYGLKYLLFSALCGILLVAFTALIIFTFKAGYLLLSLLFIILFMTVVVCWSRLNYLRNKKLKK